MEARQFVDCLDDNFLSQHVTSSTGKNAILDLIVTDEPDLIHDIPDLGALENSDHNALLLVTFCRFGSNPVVAVPAGVTVGFRQLVLYHVERYRRRVPDH